MNKLLKILDKAFFKTLSYYLYYKNGKIDIDLLRSLVAAQLKDVKPSNIILCRRIITPANTLILKLRDRHSGHGLICKIPLAVDAQEKLRVNYNSIVELSKIDSDLIPKPLGELTIKKHNVYLETWVEGDNAYDMYLKGKIDGENLLMQSEQILSGIRANIFSCIEPPVTMSNKALFLQLMEMFMTCMPSSIPYDIKEILEKIDSIWKTKDIQCGLSHGDFWFGNIMISLKDGLKVEGIIDWDRLEHNIPMLFDEMHLEIYYLCMEENQSVGHEIINCLENRKYELEDALIYWLLFIIKSKEKNTEFLSRKRWIKRNLYDMLDFLEQL